MQLSVTDLSTIVGIFAGILAVLLTPIYYQISRVVQKIDRNTEQVIRLIAQRELCIFCQSDVSQTELEKLRRLSIQQ